VPHSPFFVGLNDNVEYDDQPLIAGTCPKQACSRRVQSLASNQKCIQRPHDCAKKLPPCEAPDAKHVPAFFLCVGLDKLEHKYRSQQLCRALKAVIHVPGISQRPVTSRTESRGKLTLLRTTTSPSTAVWQARRYEAGAPASALFC